MILIANLILTLAPTILIKYKIQQLKKLSILKIISKYFTIHNDFKSTEIIIFFFIYLMFIFDLYLFYINAYNNYRKKIVMPKNSIKE